MAPQNGDMQGPIVDGRVQRTTLEADEDDSQWRFLVIIFSMSAFS